VERAESENAELRAHLEDKVKERTVALVRAARASTAGTMAGGVAHEFNNLLGGILGCAEAAQVEKPSAEVAELLTMIQKTATRGVGVTKAMLRATRAEPEWGTFEPEALFDEALAEVRPPAGIEVRRAIRKEPVAGDVAMVRQVLANLIRNAIEVMGDSGTLVLECRGESDGVVFVVGDDGPGIDPSVRDILFEPFVTTRAGGREGVGLGLFLSDRLVAAHGGRIDVESAPGTGTTFRVTLPSARDS
ncbi:MAG: HAMP domain-containing sensor histidine kinase, partial [Planctomycetota bacterium]